LTTPPPRAAHPLHTKRETTTMAIVHMGYTGPFRVVFRLQSESEERIAATGRTADGAEEVARRLASETCAEREGAEPAAAYIAVQDEPTMHTVEVVRPRER